MKSLHLEVEKVHSRTTVPAVTISRAVEFLAESDETKIQVEIKYRDGSFAARAIFAKGCLLEPEYVKRLDELALKLSLEELADSRDLLDRWREERYAEKNK